MVNHRGEYLTICIGRLTNRWPSCSITYVACSWHSSVDAPHWNRFSSHTSICIYVSCVCVYVCVCNVCVCVCVYVCVCVILCELLWGILICTCSIPYNGSWHKCLRSSSSHVVQSLRLVPAHQDWSREGGSTMVNHENILMLTMFQLLEQKHSQNNCYPGPMKPFFASSIVNLRVMCSNSFSEYLVGSILIPPFAPPKGTSTMAHLKVMSIARAFTSSSVTWGL